MKKIVTSFVALLLSTVFAALSLSAQASVLLYEEGKHYAVVSKTLSSKPNVTEYFSFYCPHCYKFEFVAKEIEKGLPDSVKFQKSHVDFMRSATPETQQALSRALVAADKLDVGHKMIEAIFAHIHKDRKPFSGEADIRKLFVENGVDGKKFDNAMKSFSVKGAANKMKKAQSDFAFGRGINSVPTFVVNGKYQLLAAELKSMEDYQNLVNYLLEKKE